MAISIRNRNSSKNVSIENVSIESPARVNFSPADVSDVAQEIAKNWLLKIMSIRGENE